MIYFYLYQVLIHLEEKYQNIYKLREILNNHQETQILQEKIKNITKKNSLQAFPYNKYHCTSWNINQSAAIIVCSSVSKSKLLS